jgi:hypothetical protein
VGGGGAERRVSEPAAVPPAARTAWTRRVALVVPLVLVNATAIYGQAAWAWDHLVPPALRTGTPAAGIAICLLFAATVESVGIYLAYEAHAALMEDQAAGMLRTGSYLVALVVGALNYAHFATQPGYRPNPLAVTFGLLSSLSPWLWAIRSRSLHRASLLARGLVDPRSVRFTLNQRLLYPVASFRAYRMAVWNGVSNPTQARADYDDARRTPHAEATAKPAVPAVPPRVPVGVPPQSKPTRRTPPAPAARTPEPAAPVRPIDSADAAILAKLRKAYPGRTPSLSEVSAVAGGAKPRAVRLRKLLTADEARTPDTDPDRDEATG